MDERRLFIISGQILCVHDQCLLQSMHQRDEESEILVQQVMFCCQDAKVKSILSRHLLSFLNVQITQHWSHLFTLFLFIKITKSSQSPCIANHPVAHIPLNFHAKLAKSCLVPWATWYGNDVARPWWPFWLPHQWASWGQCILEGCIWPWRQTLRLWSWWCWQ